MLEVLCLSSDVFIHVSPSFVLLISAKIAPKLTRSLFVVFVPWFIRSSRLTTSLEGRPTDFFNLSLSQKDGHFWSVIPLLITNSSFSLSITTGNSNLKEKKMMISSSFPPILC